MRSHAFEDKLALLVAKREIEDVLVRYCRGTDRSDKELLLTCFHPDSEHVTDSAQFGTFRGSSHAYVDQIIAVCAPMRVCTHVLSNVSIEVKGDDAISEARFLAHHAWYEDAHPDLEQHRIVEGRYLDRFLCREGDWKIIERRGVHEFNRHFSLPRVAGSIDRRDGLMAHNDPFYALERAFG